MRYVIIPLAIIIYILWTVYTGKDIMENVESASPSSGLWVLLTTVGLAIAIIKWVIPFIIEHW